VARDEKPYSMTSPCNNCPFRTDIPAYLTPERVEEIQEGLVRSEFYCHKTTKHGDEEYDEEVEDDDGAGSRDYLRKGGEKHCAGALILLEKLEQPSQMMRIAERLRIYDARKLDMTAPVFDTFEDMVEAQTPRIIKRTPKRKTAVTHKRKKAKPRS
jgi:hypothetical protein